MLSIDALKELGANTDEGLKRCMNNEAFYLRMVDMGLRDTGFDTLQSALEAGDLDKAFEAAHALKGVMGNLSLTSIAAPMSELTELLRARKEIDYTPYLTPILELKEKYVALLN